MFHYKNLYTPENLHRICCFCSPNYYASSLSFSFGDLESISKGNTITGAAGTASHRSFRKAMNFFTISLLNSSSRVKRSKSRNAVTNLKGTKRRMVPQDNNTNATSVVIWYKSKSHL